MVDQMAKRYGVLPSELISRGTTQDIWVFDVAVSYEHYQNEKQRRKQGGTPSLPQAATPEMAERLKEFKQKNENKS